MENASSEKSAAPIPEPTKPKIGGNRFAKRPRGTRFTLARRIKTTEQVLKALALGMTFERACDYAGVSTPTVRSWIEQEGPDSLLARQIPKTESKLIGDMLEVIQRAARNPAKPNWQAAAWLLERKFGYTANAKGATQAAPAAVQVLVNLANVPETAPTVDVQSKPAGQRSGAGEEPSHG